MKRIGIVLVDDHQMFREGVKAVIDDDPDLEVLGEAGTAEELHNLLSTIKPDILITDISMPDRSGIEIAKQVNQEFTDIKILFLSMHTNLEYITKAVEVGALGYLPKDAGMDELLLAIKAISKGEKVFHPTVSERLLTSYMNQLSSHGDQDLIQTLTCRENEIIKLIVEGLSNSEIANKLYISIRTVDSHKSNILQKLQLKSTVDLVKFAIKNRLATID